MADNYLEYAREDYERRKEAWLKKKKLPRRQAKAAQRSVEKPEDWAL